METTALKKLSFEKKYNLAKDIITPTEILEILASDTEWKVRKAVAYNIATPLNVLTKLATDNDWEVRFNVADNKSTPAELLAILAKDKQRWVGVLLQETKTPYQRI